MTTTREKFRAAFRATRIMRRHRVAGAAAVEKIADTDMLVRAMRCWRYPDGYHTSGGVWFSRQAAKNGYSFKHAIKCYLRAVKYRRRRAERPDLFERAT